MKVEVWIEDHEDEVKTVELKGIDPPVLPMNVRDYLCKSGFFSWRDYVRIRYRRAP